MKITLISFIIFLSFIQVSECSEIGINLDFGYNIIDIYESKTDAIKRNFYIGLSKQFTRSRHAFEIFWNHEVNVGSVTIDNYRDAYGSDFKKRETFEEIYDSNGWGFNIKQDLIFRILGQSNLRLYLGPAVMLYSENDIKNKNGWDTNFAIGIKTKLKYLTTDNYYFSISFGQYVEFTPSNNLNYSYGTMLFSFTITKKK